MNLPLFIEDLSRFRSDHYGDPATARQPVWRTRAVDHGGDLGGGHDCGRPDGTKNLYQRLHRQVVQMGLLVGIDHSGKRLIDHTNPMWS